MLPSYFLSFIQKSNTLFLILLLINCLYSCETKEPDPVSTPQPSPNPTNPNPPVSTTDTVGQNVTFFGLNTEGGKNNGGTAFKIKGNGNDFLVYHHFSQEDGTHPMGKLTWEFPYGTLIGTTSKGGKNNNGTIFSVYNSDTPILSKDYDLPATTKPGETLVNMGSFLLSPNSDSYMQSPDAIYINRPKIEPIFQLDESTGYGGSAGRLLFGRALTLFGVTPKGGKYGDGTLFKLDVSLADTGKEKLEKLLDFDFKNGNQTSIVTALALGFSTKNFYGLVTNVEGDKKISFYKYEPESNKITFIKTEFPETYLSTASNHMIMADDNTLLGLLQGDGNTSNGIIYSYNIISDTYQIEYTFKEKDGAMPKGNLVGVNGSFYGITSSGTATSPNPTVFRYNYKAKTFKVIKELNKSSDGFGATGGLYTFPQ